MKKTYTQKILGSAGCCLLAGVLTSNVAGASSQYFGVTAGIANGGSYSWDANNWSVVAGASTGPFTSPWTGGSFARFYGGTGDNYTVDVNATESMAGMFLNAGGTTTLNINNGGSGSLSVVANTSQASQNGFSWLTQGFLTGGGTVNINASIGGSGGVEEESGGGNLELLGNNTFTGGFLATSSSTFIDFNNANSFGAVTSQIGFNGTTFTIMNNVGVSGLTIANPLQFIGTGGVNFIGNGVNLTGGFYLGGGANAINIRNNGAAGQNVNFASVISGTSGAVTYSGANGGIITLSAQNTYTGNTVIGSAGDVNITLAMGAVNATATSGSIVLGGGTLSIGGYNQANVGTLGDTAGGKIDFGGLAATVSFAKSASLTYSGTINIANFNPNIDVLQVGTDATGLTSAQLSDIVIDGGTLGATGINAEGDLYLVPEPSTLALGAMGGFGMLWMFKRRKSA